MSNLVSIFSSLFTFPLTLFSSITKRRRPQITTHTKKNLRKKIQYTSARPPDSEIHQFPQMSRQTTSSKRSLRRSLLNCHKQNQTSPKYPYKSRPSRTIIIRRKNNRSCIPYTKSRTSNWDKNERFRDYMTYNDTYYFLKDIYKHN